MPKNQGIIAILAEAIEGPYRFIHEARHSIYVGVGPSTADEPITIHATHRLKLRGGQTTCRLQGLDASMTFVVMLEGVDDERLVEVGARAARPRLTPPPRVAPIAPVQAPLPQSVAIPAQPLKTPLPRMVAPEPPPVDAPIPELLTAVCQAEAVHPELGDYLVIPTGSVPEEEPLPRWVVCSPLVEQIRIVKPRLDVDRPFGRDEAHDRREE